VRECDSVWCCGVPCYQSWLQGCPVPGDRTDANLWAPLPQLRPHARHVNLSSSPPSALFVACLGLRNTHQHIVSKSLCILISLSSVRPLICVKHNSTHNSSSSPYPSFSSICIIFSTIVPLILPREATIMLLCEDEHLSMLHLLAAGPSLSSSCGLMVVHVHLDVKSISAKL
jgi:hypothetical protein